MQALPSTGNDGGVTAPCLWGRHIKYLEYHVDSNEFAFLDPRDHYECAGEEGYWPMSEKCFNNLLRVRGFRESKGGNYAEYIKHWFEAADKNPPAAAAEAAHNMLKFRREALDALKKRGDATTHELGQAQRNVELAIEVYGWSGGSKYSTESGEPVPVFADYDFFEPYRVAPGIDMWALPGELEPMLAKIIREKHPNDLRKCVARSAVPPPDVALEITYDDWDTAEPAKVVFSKPVPAQYSLVATRNCNLRTSKVWLDNDELLARRKAQRDWDRTVRQKRRQDAASM